MKPLTQRKEKREKRKVALEVLLSSFLLPLSFASEVLA
jgi:hypothetical protein